MSVLSLREITLEASAGDAETCSKIKRAAKGNFASPESLVSMYHSFQMLNFTSPEMTL